MLKNKRNNSIVILNLSKNVSEKYFPIIEIFARKKSIHSAWDAFKVKSVY